MYKNDFEPYIDIAFKIGLISSKKDIKDLIFE